MCPDLSISVSIRLIHQPCKNYEVPFFKFKWHLFFKCFSISIFNLVTITVFLSTYSTFLSNGVYHHGQRFQWFCSIFGCKNWFWKLLPNVLEFGWNYNHKTWTGSQIKASDVFKEIWCISVFTTLYHPGETSKDSANLWQYQKILIGFNNCGLWEINIFSCVQKTKKCLTKITLD